jgi:hypothetical protein
MNIIPVIVTTVSVASGMLGVELYFRLFPKILLLLFNFFVAVISQVTHLALFEELTSKFDMLSQKACFESNFPSAPIRYEFLNP